MATKSKNTDTFQGVISWLSMILLTCAVIVGILFTVMMMANSEIRQLTVKFLTSFNDGAPGEALGQTGAEYHQHLEENYNLALPLVGGLVLLAAATALTFAFRQSRKRFEAAMARGLGKIWVEIKLLLIVGLGFVSFMFMRGLGYYYTLGERMVNFSLGLCIPVLILYFLCLDIGHNGRFFSHNIIHSILTRATAFNELSSFEKRSLRRLYVCLTVILGILVLATVMMAALNDALFYRPLLLLAFGFSVTVGIVGTILWYVVSLKQDLRDWNVLMQQIAEMYGGNMDAVNHVPPASNLYNCAMQLNMIRIGIQKAVEEGIKADRTKVELITNVSHDIKTPLTSIISYIELMKKEKDLPPHVMDYVNTISVKADRLGHIVQDVFDVSKAATGNISLDLEDLDVGKLLQQTFGEMDETLKDSPLTWRVEIPETPILIHADGQKLYRVFQNLIRNCSQYSLEGSRVYVQLTAQSGAALVTIRNISKSEITMNGDDLTARFVRGDQNRTTEGSGLGLSIAKSFTEACGGQFRVYTDGDLFTATVQFPQVIKEPVPSLTLETAPAE